MQGYWRASLSPAYNFFLALVLLVGYEGILRLTSTPISQRNLVEVGLTHLIGWASPYEWVLSVMIALLGVVYVYFIRRESTRLTDWVFGLMILEATAWAAALYKLLPWLTQTLFPHPAQLNPFSPAFWESVALCMGAGFYEELFFRLLLVEGLLYLATGFHPRKATAFHYLVIWTLSAALFSAAHFLYEEPTSYAFWYRFLFGLFMSGLYLLRGFGIAAWSHAIYDMAVLWWR